MSTSEFTLNAVSPNGLILKVDLHNLKKAALVLRAINHKLRQQILKLIDEHGRVTVTELYVKMRLEQSVASQHLAILRKAGFVKTVRDGKFIYYSVNIDRMDEVNQFLAELLD
ncbi:MAG: metalloregulator ArsR/SmtB family transcription factor [Bacteroidota bacterium]